MPTSREEVQRVVNDGLAFGCFYANGLEYREDWRRSPEADLLRARYNWETKLVTEALIKEGIVELDE